MSYAYHRRMRAVRRTERVANENAIAQCGKLFRKGLVVFLFFGVEAHVLEQQHIPIL
jgi:hypothetical protein